MANPLPDTRHTAPRLLYKYRAGSIQDLTNLSGGKLWFSSPTRFNDPFDCAYDVAISDISKVECIAFLTHALGGNVSESVLARVPDDALQQQVKDGLKRAVEVGLSGFRGVCCFSAVRDDLLSWGHYSDCHRGFCLEFDTVIGATPPNGAAGDGLFQKVHKVLYSDTLPCIGIDAFWNEDYRPILQQMVLTKRECWQHEREWRVLHRNADFLFSYRPESLVGVYFGAKMPEDQMRMIRGLLGKADTICYRMCVDKSRGAVVPAEVAF